MFHNCLICTTCDRAVSPSPKIIHNVKPFSIMKSESALLSYKKLHRDDISILGRGTFSTVWAGKWGGGTVAHGCNTRQSNLVWVINVIHINGGYFTSTGWVVASVWDDSEFLKCLNFSKFRHLLYAVGYTTTLTLILMRSKEMSVLAYAGCCF